MYHLWSYGGKANPLEEEPADSGMVGGLVDDIAEILENSCQDV